MSGIFSHIKHKSSNQSNDQIKKLFEKSSANPQTFIQEQQAQPLQQEEDKQVSQQSQDQERSHKVQLTAVQLAQENTRTLFIGNVPCSARSKKLVRLFKPFGVIEKYRSRSVPVAQQGKAPIRAKVIMKEYSDIKDTYNVYLVFKNKDSVQKALELNGHIFEGKHLRVDKVSKYPMTSKLKDQQENDYHSTLFIGNLPFKTQQQQLWQFFQQYGTIKNVRIVRDKQTHIGKGIAFVQFETKDQMKIAMAKGKNTQFNDRDLRVKKASPPERLAKKFVKKQMKVQQKRKLKREMKAQRKQKRPFVSTEEYAQKGVATNSSAGEDLLVNRVKLKKKQERKILQEMIEGNQKSKTLLKKHKHQFGVDTSREDVITKRKDKKKQNASKLNNRVKIKKFS